MPGTDENPAAKQPAMLRRPQFLNLLQQRRDSDGLDTMRVEARCRGSFNIRCSAVPRQGNQPYLRPQRSKAFCKLVSVHLRQSDVQHAYIRSEFTRHREGIGTILGQRDNMADTGERRAKPAFTSIERARSLCERVEQLRRQIRRNAGARRLHT